MSPPRPTNENGAREKNAAKKTINETGRHHRSAHRDNEQARPYVVRYQKHNGTALVFGRYSTEAEATEVCSLLKWAGAVAHVEELAA